MVMISKRIDRIVEWTKWPAAFVALLTIPMTANAWVRLLRRSVDYPIFMISFCLGVAVLMLMSRSQISKSPWVVSLVQFERDITQSALAMVMLHPVVGFGENRSKGTHVRWLGKGNWIMLAAPYFIPTLTIGLWLVSLVLFQTLRCFVLGFGISYHVAAVIIQWNQSTSELRRLGKRFCWMFLPAANFLVVGLVLSFALNGFTGISQMLQDWLQLPRIVIQAIWSANASGSA